MQFSLHEHSQVPRDRMILDLLSVQPPAGVVALPKSNWIILVDECTNFKISHFFHAKDQMTEAMRELLKGWRDKGIVTKFMCMDKTGENKLLEQRARSKDWQLGIHMEYTPRDMPQHNHLAELAFAAIGNKGRAFELPFSSLQGGVQDHN